MTAATRRTWVAAFDTTCATCATPLTMGDLYFIAPGNTTASGLDCCGDKDDADLVVHELRDDSLAVDDEDPADAIARVLPRGKTARDACGTCHLIPANNGTCGCHT